MFVHNVDNPIYPLLASKERTLFKLFLSDVGLLTYKLCNGNLDVNGKIIYLPIYIISFIQHIRMYNKQINYKPRYFKTNIKI